MTSHAIRVDEITEVMISIKKFNKNLSILKKIFFLIDFAWFLISCQYVYLYQAYQVGRSIL